MDDQNEEYPLEPTRYSSQALYIARQIKANETLVDRVEAAMGKSDAMRVRRLEKTIENLEAELDRQDRESLALRRAGKAEHQYYQIKGVLRMVSQMLGEEPLPVHELKYLVEQELSKTGPWEIRSTGP